MKEVAPGNRELRFYFYILAGIWAVCVLGMMLWSLSRVNETTKRLASQVARAHSDKDWAFRLWGVSHGGVYVPIDARTPPNPYLEARSRAGCENSIRQGTDFNESLPICSASSMKTSLNCTACRGVLPA